MHCAYKPYLFRTHAHSALLNQNKSGGGRSGWIKLYAIFTPGANWAGPTFQPPRSSRNPMELFWSGSFQVRAQNTRTFHVQTGHILNVNAIFQMWYRNGTSFAMTCLGDNSQVISGNIRMFTGNSSRLRAAKYSSSLKAAPCQVERGTSCISNVTHLLLAFWHPTITEIWLKFWY